MRRLTARDISILKRAFVKALNEEVNGNEEKCVDRTRNFRATGKEAYSEQFLISFRKLLRMALSKTVLIRTN
jgi:hypothetical protein